MLELPDGSQNALKTFQSDCLEPDLDKWNLLAHRRLAAGMMLHKYDPIQRVQLQSLPT